MLISYPQANDFSTLSRLRLCYKTKVCTTTLYNAKDEATQGKDSTVSVYRMFDFRLHVSCSS